MFQNKIIRVRMASSLLMQLTKMVRENKEIYKSKSHFIRCAIIRELRANGFDWNPEIK